MKKRINLLKTQKRFINIENAFRKLKTITIVLFFIFLTVYLAFFYLLAKQKQSIDALLSQKEGLIEFFIQNKEVEAKFVYFRNKQRQLTDILKEDVNFFPYYNLLGESINTFTTGARLESVLIDKAKSVKFSVSFESYVDLIDFLRYAESEDFLKNFNQLTLINFSNTDAQETRKDLILNFSGNFINLNES